MIIFLNRIMVKLSLAKSLLIWLLLATLSFSPLATASPKPPIMIPLLDWSSQRVVVKAIGLYFTEHKYPVIYKTMTSNRLWGSLARGNVYFHTNVWQASGGKKLQSMLEKKRIIDMGNHSAQTMEEWWYPLYVEKHCPGLPDWGALLQCSHIFAPSDDTKGVYNVGPWQYNDADLIRSLGLNFHIKEYQNYNQIWKKLERAIARQQPILLLNWTPNWTDQRIPGRFIEFPLFHPKCETQASWGINPELKYDCGNIRNGWIKKVAWNGLEQTAPCIFKFIGNMDLTNPMIAEASALVDYDKKSEDLAAILWLEKYRSKFRTWTAKGCFNTAS